MRTVSSERQRKILIWLWRELRSNLSITVVTAVLFATAFRESFTINLVYSFCVSTSIQVLIECGRYGFAYWIGQRPAPESGQRPWPGWMLMGPWVTVSAIAGWLIGEHIGDRIIGLKRASTMSVGDPRLLLFTLVCVLAISLGITYFYYARGRLATMEVREQTAMRSAAENQLKLLVSQLEPHMLFNTLANLRVLIGQDPERAQAMLDHLNSFLRATLDASRVDAHSLSSEFSRIGDYLELMKVRMGPRLQDRLELPPELGSLRVPPLLLQPLVENSIKHGLEPKVAGGSITVSAALIGDKLVLSVRDTGVGLGAPRAPGTRFGLQQVRDRIAALYGDSADLELSDAGDAPGGVLAVVRLPYRNVAAETSHGQ